MISVILPSEKFLHFFHCVLIFSSQLYGGFFEKCFQLILEATIEGYLGNWEDIYGKNPNYTTIGTRFIEILRRAYEQTGRRAVVLIDEYDKPILDVLDVYRSLPFT